MRSRGLPLFFIRLGGIYIGSPLDPLEFLRFMSRCKSPARPIGSETIILTLTRCVLGNEQRKVL